MTDRNEQQLSKSKTVYVTASGAYWRAFAISAAFGGLLVILGGLLLISQQLPFAAAILLGMGAMLLINAAGHAKSSRAYRALAAEQTNET